MTNQTKKYDLVSLRSKSPRYYNWFQSLKKEVDMSKIYLKNNYKTVLRVKEA